jgi:NAD(P)-dependent dehydrogenase (short-subunit alcohol dehydrogenase family)
LVIDDELGGGLAVGRRVIVAGTSGPGAGIAGALADAGARVAVLSPSSVADQTMADSVQWIATSFGSSKEVTVAVEVAVDALGGVDQFVYCWYPAGLTESATFAEVGADQWTTTCEGTLDAAWWLVRALVGPLKSSGGRSMVFVVPTVGMSGASGFVMLATVAEGLRVMAKGCGRCWGGDGITVNTVATSPTVWVDPQHQERLSREISLSVPAMGRAGDPGGDLAPLVELLGTEEGHFLTAATLVADGGLWMGL